MFVCTYIFRVFRMSLSPVSSSGALAEPGASRTPYERFAISMPASMADDIRSLCQRESRSHSEFFREAVRSYLQQRQASTPPAPKVVSTHSNTVPVLPTREPRLAPSKEDVFADFSEWVSDREYNALIHAAPARS